MIRTWKIVRKPATRWPIVWYKNATLTPNIHQSLVNLQFFNWYHERCYLKAYFAPDKYAYPGVTSGRKMMNKTYENIAFVGQALSAESWQDCQKMCQDDINRYWT